MPSGLQLAMWQKGLTYVGICKVIVRFCVRCTDVARAVIDDIFYMYVIGLVQSCL